MAMLRRFCCNDLLRFTSVNLDHLIHTGEMFLYLNLLAQFPNYFLAAVAPGNRIVGYLLGTVTEPDEGQKWEEGIAMTVTVASEHRRQKIATRLMQLFEKKLMENAQSTPWDLYLVCLYVAVNNTPARELFERLGYEVIREMPGFDEETLEMKKVISEKQELFRFYGDQ